MNSTDTTRRAVLAGSKLRAVVPQRLILTDLENQICDLDRAARIAYLMMMHDAENPGEEQLGLFAVEHVERLASELRASFYATEGKAVQS